MGKIRKETVDRVVFAATTSTMILLVVMWFCAGTNQSIWWAWTIVGALVIVLGVMVATMALYIRQVMGLTEGANDDTLSTSEEDE